MRMGTGEILALLAVVLLLFGASRLPQLGASLGQAIRNFKRGFSGAEEPEPGPGDAGKSQGQMTSGNTVAQGADARPKVASKEG